MPSMLKLMRAKIRMWRERRRYESAYKAAHGAFERIDAMMKLKGVPRAERRRIWREVTGNRELR